jgi:hypothetical protein
MNTFSTAIIQFGKQKYCETLRFIECSDMISNPDTCSRSDSVLNRQTNPSLRKENSGSINILLDLFLGPK